MTEKKTVEYYKSLSERNVLDKFKEMPTEDIKKHLQSTAFPYAAVMENWVGDFNLATVLRNANAFNAKEMYYLKTSKKFDKRATVGCTHYTDLFHLSSLEELNKLRDKFPHFIGIDCVPGSSSIEEHTFKENSLFIFGEEGVGLTKEVMEICDVILHIDQFGSVRSLNAGTSSGIIFHRFVNDFRKGKVQK